MGWRGLLTAAACAALVMGGGGAARAASGTDSPAVSTPSGVLRVDIPAGETTDWLYTYDPDTGKPRGAYPTPWRVFNDTTDIAFSHDRRYAAAAVGGRAIALAEFTGSRYEEVYRWTKDAVPGADPDGTLGNPAFTTDGMVKFSSNADIDQGGGAVVAGYTADPADPAGRLFRDDEAGDEWDYWGIPVHHTSWTINGVSQIDGRDITVRALVSSDEITAAWIVGVDDPSFTPYRCTEQLDTITLLCMADLAGAAADGYDPPFGTVARLGLDDNGVALDISEVVGTLPAHSAPWEPNPADALYLSPDRQRVLMETANGWYTAPVDGTTAPQYAFAHLGAGETIPGGLILGWGPHHYITPTTID